MVLGDLGGHDLEDLATEDPQLGGVEVRGLGDQVGLGLGPDRVVEAVGELAQRGGDRVRLLDVDAPGPDRVGERVPARVQLFGEPTEADRGTGRDPGLVGQPRRRGPGPGVQGDVVGGGDHPEQEALGAADHPGQLDHRGGLRRRVSCTAGPPRRPRRARPRSRRHRPAPGARSRGRGVLPCAHASRLHRHIRHTFDPCGRSVPGTHPSRSLACGRAGRVCPSGVRAVGLRRPPPPSPSPLPPRLPPLGAVGGALGARQVQRDSWR